MCRFPPAFRHCGRVSVVLALLSVALTPRFARAQSLASNERPLGTVRHTLAGEVGSVVRARWSRWSFDARVGEWSATARVGSNVPVQATAHAEGATISGWLVRTHDGELVPWDGRETAVSALLQPGESEVAVQLVPPAGATEQVLHSVRLRVRPALRP